MQWKKAFTIALAVFMLTVSSWAMACDAMCMLRSALLERPLSQGSSVQMSHAHCAHMGRPGTSTSASSFVQATSSCTHSLCRQPDSLVDPAKSVQFDRMQWTIVHQVLIGERGLAPNRFVSEAPPPVIVPSLAPLSVTLRI